MTDEPTTIEGRLAELNFMLDLPHGDLPAVTADQFAHGWRLMGPGIPTTNGLSEDALGLILTGMIAGLSAAEVRDRA